MKLQWRTAWQGQEIVVFREDEEIDRFDAAQIQRVIFVHQDSGDSPGDLVLAVVELAEEHLLLPADTGFAGRVNFERQAWWTERACVYWVNEAQAALPMRLRRGRWFLGFAGPTYARLPRTELAALVERWPVQGPQTWEQRKWRRIERNRPFAPDDDAQLRA
ncbi:MAG: hypothetical protein ABL916_21830 [Burkholderiaceae bacterium]